MKKLWVVVVLLALMTSLFTGCAKDDQLVLNVYNWGDYIDEDIFDEFEEETGIKITMKRMPQMKKCTLKLKKVARNTILLFLLII